jgi:hypothetical protein
MFFTVTILFLLVVGGALFLSARSAQKTVGEQRIQKPATSSPKAIPGAATNPKVIPVKTSPPPKDKPTVDSGSLGDLWLAIADSASSSPSYSSSSSHPDCSSSYDHSSSSHDSSCDSDF